MLYISIFIYISATLLYELREIKRKETLPLWKYKKLNKYKDEMCVVFILN